MSISELHFTTRRLTRFYSWAAGTLAAVALVAVYAAVQYHEDNVLQREEINAFKSRGCPASFRGQSFSFSAYEQVNVLRPKHARLACYYSKGVMS